MKCPRCGAVMVECAPSIIYLTNPPQYDRVLWCACGHQEALGRTWERSGADRLYDEWTRANNI